MSRFKEYLRQAYRLDQRIQSDIKEVEHLRDMLCSVGSPSFESHYNPNPPTEAPFVKGVERIVDMEEKINAEIDKLVALKAQIRSVIASVGCVDEQMVLRYRYIHNMTWKQIGDKLYADRTTVYRWHNAAIRHLVLPDNPIII